MTTFAIAPSTGCLKMAWFLLGLCFLGMPGASPLVDCKASCRLTELSPFVFLVHPLIV